jgi:hypothetical protein
MDVEATRAIRQAEVGAAKTMIERTEERFDIKPERLAADTAYGSAAHLNWLVNEKKIAPHIPVIDKSKRDDGTFAREDFTFDKVRDLYVCPAGELLGFSINRNLSISVLTAVCSASAAVRGERSRSERKNWMYCRRLRYWSYRPCALRSTTPCSSSRCSMYWRVQPMWTASRALETNTRPSTLSRLPPLARFAPRGRSIVAVSVMWWSP